MVIRDATDVRPGTMAASARVLPGILATLLAVAIGLLIQRLFHEASPLLSALVLGVVFANVGMVPESLRERLGSGFAFASRRFLRLGIVLLGLQIVLGDVLGLGAGMLVVVVVIVGSGIGITLGLGAILGVPIHQRILIACGFSICGAAAIAGTSQVIEAEEEDVAAGIALVSLFGTAMIVIIPVLARPLGLSDAETGMWAGGSIHEVAQVVAVGGSIGGSALAVAILVKLARVMMLAPVAAALGMWHRRRSPSTAERPALVPLFVAGFIAMVLIRTTGWIPVGVVHAATTGQMWLLAAAMFAIGCGCRFASIKQLGWRPLALGALSTLAVATVSYLGIITIT